jgi:hypothetical protein
MSEEDKLSPEDRAWVLRAMEEYAKEEAEKKRLTEKSRTLKTPDQEKPA